jgi:hypothetical protein
MVAARVNAVREVLLARAATQWRIYRRTGLLRCLFNKLVGFHPPDRLRVTEHPWDGGKHLVEPPTRAWCVDDDGPRAAQMDVEHDPELRGMYYSVFAIRFGISSDARRVLWEEVSGPQAGIGLECSLSDDPQRPQIEGSRMVWHS